MFIITTIHLKIPTSPTFLSDRLERKMKSQLLWTRTCQTTTRRTMTLAWATCRPKPFKLIELPLLINSVPVQSLTAIISHSLWQVLPIQVAVQKKAKRGVDVVEKPPDLAEEARKKVDVFCPESFYKYIQNMNSDYLFPSWIQQLLT